MRRPPYDRATFVIALPLSVLAAGLDLEHVARALDVPTQVLKAAAAVFALLFAVYRWKRRKAEVPELDVSAFAAKARMETNKRRAALLFQAPRIDLEFAQLSPTALTPLVTAPGGRLSQIGPYFEGIGNGRLVILGPSGSGKTVLGLELLHQLLSDPRNHRIVPIQVDLLTWSEGSTLEECVVAQVCASYRGVSPNNARAALHARELLLVVDGLDELDPDDEDAAPSRAAAILNQLNSRELGDLVPVVVTARQDAYARLLPRDRLTASTVVKVAPLDSAHVTQYLDDREVAHEGWAAVVEELRDRPDGPLAALQRPWWLGTAVTVCAGGGPGPRRHPSELLTLATAEQLEPQLLADYTALLVARLRGKAKRNTRALVKLARYLQENTRDHRKIDGQTLDRTAIVVHRLWPIAGAKRVLWTDAALAALMSTPGLVAGTAWLAPKGPWGLPVAVVGVTLWLWRVWVTPRTPWIAPAHMNPRRLLSREGALQLSVAVAVFASGLLIWNWVGAAALALAVWVGLGLTLGKSQALVSFDAVEARGPDEPLSEEFFISSFSAVVCWPALTLMAEPWIGLPLAASASAAYCALVGLTVASAVWRRYIVLLLLTRGALPWRLRRFLRDACDVGLLRRAGIAYQFRHQELQGHLARHAEAAVTSKPERRWRRSSPAGAGLEVRRVEDSAQAAHETQPDDDVVDPIG